MAGFLEQHNGSSSDAYRDGLCSVKTHTDEGCAETVFDLPISVNQKRPAQAKTKAQQNGLAVSFLRFKKQGQPKEVHNNTQHQKRETLAIYLEYSVNQ